MSCLGSSLAPWFGWRTPTHQTGVRSMILPSFVELGNASSQHRSRALDSLTLDVVRFELRLTSTSFLFLSPWPSCTLKCPVVHLAVLPWRCLQLCVALLLASDGIFAHSWLSQTSAYLTTGLWHPVSFTTTKHRLAPLLFVFSTFPFCYIRRRWNV